MYILKDYHIFAIKDKINQVHCVICEEKSDNIFLDHIYIDEDTCEIFEWDAYHLEDWAKRYGLDYFEDQQEIKIFVKF